MKVLVAFFALSFSVVGQAPLRIVLAGDSTVCDYPETGHQRGWGQYLGGYFGDSVKVYNLAKGGRSTKTFLNEGLWAKSIALKPDFILIQFGHNDSHDPKNPEATNAATDYSAYLRQFVDEARAAGAVPILVTPVQRRTKVDTLIPYADAMRKVAAEKRVGLVDLHASSGKLYRELGEAGAAELAANSTDNTHFNEKGAAAMAKLVMDELPALDPRLKLALRAGSARTATFQDCRASWDGSRLVIANRYIERQWLWRNGQFYATSFRDLESGVEWLDAKIAGTAAGAPSFTAKSGVMNPVQAASLLVEMAASNGVTYRFQIFPEARGVMMQMVQPAAARSDVLDALTLNAEHIQLTQVTLMDQTDAHNQLVFEREWLPQRNEKELHLEGNLFVAENSLTHAGLVFLKLAPLPNARPVKSAWDLESVVRGRTFQCTLTGNGLDATGGAGYPYVVLAYRGGRMGRTEALQTFQRQLHPQLPGRDGMFLSNTWGDRSRDARINTEFMRKEIEAGSALGVDVIQIDDGWQTGRTSNSARGPGVWTGYWAQNPNFWQPDPVRFPGGLRPLVDQAAAKGIKFGLWFGPDSSNDFGNWQKDADRLLELHRQDGIDYFKIDGVKAVSKAAERNLRRMFDRVQEGSKGRVVFDLDVTAETRPGYFGVPDVGPLFVENRYTDSHSYWPHQTLRNLWQLAQYVDPLRLRMEVLNNQRNLEAYKGDPLGPAAYNADYLFATVMFANPLGWFEMSNLPVDYESEMASLVKVWKGQRDALHADVILPIGEAPDGTNWTGFAAFAKDHTSGSVLLFRGHGAPVKWRTPLEVYGLGKHAVKVLGGAGNVQIDGGELVVSIPASPGFVWAEILR